MTWLALVLALMVAPASPAWAAESELFYGVHKDYADLGNAHKEGHPGEITEINTGQPYVQERSTLIVVPETAFASDIDVHLGDIVLLDDMVYGPPNDLSAIDWLEQARVRFARNQGRTSVWLKHTDRTAWGAESVARPTMGRQLFDRDNGNSPEFIFRWNIHSGNETIYFTYQHAGKTWYASPRGEISLTPWNWWAYRGFFMRITADKFLCLSDQANRDRLEDHILEPVKDAH